MTGVNKVILLGNLGKDPEIRTLDGGRKVASFSLATNENIKDKTGNWTTLTEWHNIVCWGGLVDRIEGRIRKGSLVFIEGKLRTSSWDDKNTGAKRFKTEIMAESVNMLEGKRDDASDASAPMQQSAPAEVLPAQPIGTDDLPF